MIEVFKIMRGIVDISKDDFFKLPPLAVTRGNSLKITKMHAQSRAWRNHLCVWVVNEWNGLPECRVVSSATLNCFKNNLNK